VAVTAAERMPPQAVAAASARQSVRPEPVRVPVAARTLPPQ